MCSHNNRAGRVPVRESTLLRRPEERHCQGQGRASPRLRRQRVHWILHHVSRRRRRLCVCLCVGLPFNVNLIWFPFTFCLRYMNGRCLRSCPRSGYLIKLCVEKKYVIGRPYVISEETLKQEHFNAIMPASHDTVLLAFVTSHTHS